MIQSNRLVFDFQHSVFQLKIQGPALFSIVATPLLKATDSITKSAASSREMKEAYVERVSKDLAQGHKEELANFAHIPLIPLKEKEQWSKQINFLFCRSLYSTVLVFLQWQKIKYKIC